MEISRISAELPAFGDAVGRARWLVPALDGVFSCAPHGDAAAKAPQLAAAEAPARRGDWQEVRRLLEDVPLDEVAEEVVAHHCHLLGIAWLRTGGDRARVHALWRRGSASEQSDRSFPCQLAACVDLLEPIPDPLPPQWWSAGTPVIRQLRVAIATADRRLAERRPRAAREVLRQRVVTRTRELQSTARLAAAWLEVDPEHTGEAFDKAIALSHFVALAAQPRHSLPIEDAWATEQVTAIAGRAAQWLASWHERV
ncbi:MAG TPA: hypothetical protein VFT22_09475 [Kofleriaceae bacterium]|nr:hypothetical protein [Kofleriaceae bacterium]